jgi:hypothetical protein
MRKQKPYLVDKLGAWHVGLAYFISILVTLGNNTSIETMHPSEKKTKKSSAT